MVLIGFVVQLKLKDVLKSRNITQKELATLTGIRESTISEIVRGTKTCLNFKHFAKIAECLDITNISDLVCLKEVQNGTDERDQM